ncbi:hypothetical protein [Kitasatospora sp. NPDC088548]|uniref:hypothetical protein n=1 Tax=Kitasatospora sp. NPDC088548 TaxID=3364075 RepID=UPI0038270537
MTTLSKPTVVPYVSSWRTEREHNPTLVFTAAGIRYEDEGPGDRDNRGVLWVRQEQRRGQGTPDYGGINAARQRRCMSRFLCQVCAGSPSITADGMLFVIFNQREPGWDDWPERMGTTHPPLCTGCARKAAQQCHAFAKGFTAVRSRSPAVAGVMGVVFDPARLVSSPERVVQYDQPDVLRWTVANQLVAILLDCTAIEDLDADLDKADRNAAPIRD